MEKRGVVSGEYDEPPRQDKDSSQEKAGQAPPPKPDPELSCGDDPLSRISDRLAGR